MVVFCFMSLWGIFCSCGNVTIGGDEGLQKFKWDLNCATHLWFILQSHPFDPSNFYMNFQKKQFKIIWMYFYRESMCWLLHCLATWTKLTKWKKPGLFCFAGERTTTILMLLTRWSREEWMELSMTGEACHSQCLLHYTKNKQNYA